MSVGKTFNGKRYGFYRSASTKVDAVRSANQVRKNGGCARITVGTNGKAYEVWVRNKSK